MKYIECFEGTCAQKVTKQIVTLGKCALTMLYGVQHRYVANIIANDRRTRHAFALRLESLVETVDPDMLQWQSALPAAARLGVLGKRIIDGTIDEASVRDEMSDIAPLLPVPAQAVYSAGLHPRLVEAVQPYLEELLPPPETV